MKRLLVLIGIALLIGTVFEAEACQGNGNRGQKRQFAKRFNNGENGPLSEEERAAIRTQRQEMKAKMLEEFDADNDGKLSEEERAAAKQARTQQQHDRKLLKRFDADQNGELSGEERAAAEQAFEERRARALEEFDLDNDGKLSSEERDAMKEARHLTTRERQRARKGNNGVGNGVDPAPMGNPPVNDGPGTGPGNPGNRD